MELNLTKGQRRLRAVARTVKTTIICLQEERDVYGVYACGMYPSGPYGTPLLFKGTFSECNEWRRY